MAGYNKLAYCFSFNPQGETRRFAVIAAVSKTVIRKTIGTRLPSISRMSVLPDSKAGLFRSEI